MYKPVATGAVAVVSAATATALPVTGASTTVTVASVLGAGLATWAAAYFLVLRFKKQA